VLALGALETGHVFVVAVLMLSSLLSVAYLLPIVARAFFLPAPAEAHHANGGPGAADGIHEAPVACLIALCATAILCVVLFAEAGRIEALLAGIFAVP
jgi:multicomponent Na+:H+ antiporter subunit D